MTAARDAELDAVILVVLGKLVGAREKEAREAINMGRGNRHVIRIGDQKIGAVTRTDPAVPAPYAHVKDEAAFLAWAEGFMPDEIVGEHTVDVTPALVEWLLTHRPEAVTTTRQVRSSTRGAVLGSVAEGEFEWADADGVEGDGPPPGVEVVTPTGATSQLKVETTPDAALVVGKAWAAGELDVDLLPQLEAGES